VHGAVHNTFNFQRHLIFRSTLRIFRAEASAQWQDAVARYDARRVLALNACSIDCRDKAARELLREVGDGETGVRRRIVVVFNASTSPMKE
jgi:hypothetical protein